MSSEVTGMIVELVSGEVLAGYQGKETDVSGSWRE